MREEKKGVRSRESGVRERSLGLEKGKGWGLRPSPLERMGDGSPRAGSWRCVEINFQSKISQ